MRPFIYRLEEIASAPWLRATWLYRFVWTCALHFDALVDWTFYGLIARWPHLAPSDALPVLGRERGIRRGISETDASYVSRLLIWLVSRRFRGNPYALADQLAGWLGAKVGVIRVVNQQGAWYTRLSDGTREYHRATPTNFSWDAYPTQWSRYWVILYPSDTCWNTRKVLTGLTTWGDHSGTWGTTMSRGEAEVLRAIVGEWNPPHARCSHIVLAYDDASFAPTASPGAPMPDGTWEFWGYDPGTGLAPARLNTARYGRAIQEW